MSILHCNNCDANIDTDFKAEHFMEAPCCVHENVTTEYVYHPSLNRDVASRVCDDCEKVLPDPDCDLKNKDL